MHAFISPQPINLDAAGHFVVWLICVFGVTALLGVWYMGSHRRWTPDAFERTILMKGGRGFGGG